jgi:hypothetical protein
MFCRAVGDRDGLPLSLSGGLVGPGLSSASTATKVIAGPTTSSSTRVGRSVPAVTTTTVRFASGLGLGAALHAMAVLGAVGALDTAPVLRLGALAAHVAFGIAVAAALNARLGAVRDVVAGLKAVEARATYAAARTRLEGLGTIGLAVARR